MGEWYYGWELIQTKGWTPTKLLNNIKNGLPAYDEEIDRQIFDLDTRPRHKKTIEEIEREEDTKRKKAEKWAGPCMPLPKTIIEGIHKNQTGIPIIPPGHKAMSFTLPTGKTEALKLFDKIKMFRFKHQDIIDYEQSHGRYPTDPGSQHDTAPAPATPTPEQTDPEAVIRNLQIAYESDTEISVKVGTKKQKTYSSTDMGFAREDTKAWRALIQILKSPDHSYHVGVAYGEGKKRNPTYDNNRAILREISKKIVSSFNKTNTPPLPDNFQIFERNKAERSGTYGPKFAIPILSIGDVDYNDLSRDTLIADIEELSSRRAVLDSRGGEDSEKELCRIIAELEGKVIIAVNKKWLGQNRAKSYLNPPTAD